MDIRLLILALVSMTVRGRGQFELTLTKYINDKGHDFLNRHCDSDGGTGKESDCDTFFVVHLNLSKSLSYPPIKTQVYHNVNTITFGSSLGNGHFNPIRRTFQSWFGSLIIKIDVVDHDSGPYHVYIDKFLLHLNQTVHGTDKNYLSYGALSHSKKLYFSLKVTCDSYYYVPDCSTYCRPQSSGSCRYTCLHDGNKQCLRGWRSPSTGCCECHCSDHGTCTPTTDSFRCSCTAGWTGDLCQHDVDECKRSSHLCKNGGTCVNTHGSFKCFCPPGFTRTNCEDVDECKISPPICKNKGNCTNVIGSFRCSCPKEFTGKTCEQDVNECRLTPPVCMNNGKCNNIHGSFLCSCPPQFTGRRCEIDVDECKTQPPVCKNGGVCENKFGSFTCKWTKPTTQPWKTAVPSTVVPLLVIIAVIIAVVIYFFKCRRISTDDTQRNRSMSCTSQAQLASNSTFGENENPYSTQDADDVSVYSEVGPWSPYRESYNECYMIASPASSSRTPDVQASGGPTACYRDGAARLDFDGGHQNCLKINEKNNNSNANNPYVVAGDDYESMGNPSNHTQAHVSGQQEDGMDEDPYRCIEVSVEHSVPRPAPRKTKQSETNA